MKRSTGKRMEKIRIRHIPRCIYIILGILSVMVIGMDLSLKKADNYEKSDLIFVLIVCFLFFAVLIMIGFVKTKVRFGEGSTVKCQWLFLFWKIDLNNINGVTYTLKSNRTRGGGTSYSLHMFFYVDADNFKVLTEPLKQHIAEECIRHRFNQAELMKLYRYIEQNYPDIAKGHE